jgi:hypothetical protein
MLFFTQRLLVKCFVPSISKEERRLPRISALAKMDKAL